MTPVDELMKVSDAIRFRVLDKPRVSVTEFARGKEWRTKLSEVDVIEVMDRGDTAGWLVSSKGMESMLGRITQLEGELERLQIEMMFEARSDYQDWKAGEDLCNAALADFETCKDALKAAVDGD